ncbi:MAG: methyltransferase [Melioribacteraceae bacterium]
MLNYKDVYNKVYSEKDDYGDIKHSRPDLKEKVILDFIDNKDGTVLDIGSGSGYYLSSLINHGIHAFGIEVSDICCEKYLTSLPHKCTDIIKYSKFNTTPKFDYAICNDFIEHIYIEDLDSVLKSIVKLSGDCLFGIANHNEFLCGMQIHQIVQGVNFWIEKLNEYYKNVELVSILMDSRFFFVKCSNKKR